MFVRLGIRFAVVGTVLVGAMVWHYTDRALNFVELEGRVDAVRATCNVKGARGSLAYIDDCDELSSMMSDGEVAAGDLRRTTRVTVRYTSPADGQIHSATFKTSSDKPDPAMIEGGVFTIYASKTSPEKIVKQ